MINKLTHVCIPVTNYDEAISWYTEKLGLVVNADEAFGPGYRWVTLGAKEQQDIEISLFQINDQVPDERLKKAGQIAGWVFGTDNCREEVESLRNKGVKIVMEPNDAPWGTQAMFEDLYGNTFVMVEPRTYTKEELENYEA